jgi:hypothetical protein
MHRERLSCCQHCRSDLFLIVCCHACVACVSSYSLLC